MNALAEPAVLAQPLLQSAPSGARSTPVALPTEFLSFRLGAEEYAIDILQVQEIRSYEPPTRLPNSAAFVRGAVNLRGVIVPVVDLRMLFELSDAACTSVTAVVVLNVRGRVVGCAVDSVSDVIEFSQDQLKPVPAFNSRVSSDHLLAIGTLEERMLILLDIASLLSSPAVGLISQG